MGSRVRVPYAPHKISRYSNEYREIFVFFQADSDELQAIFWWACSAMKRGSHGDNREKQEVNN